MKYEPLDSKSENILKLFKKHRILSIDSIGKMLNIDWFVAAEYVKLLYQDGYIGPYSAEAKLEKVITQEMSYIIDTKGDIYFDLQRKHKITVIQNSILLPISVTILTNLATKLISTWLK